MQRNEDRAAVLIVGRILRGQLLVNQAHFRTRLFDRHSGRKASVGPEKMYAPKFSGQWIRDVNRGPGFGIVPWRAEAGGHDANDRVDVAAQRNRLTHDLLITAELALPQRVTQHDHKGSAALVIVRSYEPASFRLHTQ